MATNLGQPNALSATLQNRNVKVVTTAYTTDYTDDIIICGGGGDFIVILGVSDLLPVGKRQTVIQGLASSVCSVSTQNPNLDLCDFGQLSDNGTLGSSVVAIWDGENWWFESGINIAAD